MAKTKAKTQNFAEKKRKSTTKAKKKMSLINPSEKEVVGCSCGGRRRKEEDLFSP